MLPLTNVEQPPLDLNSLYRRHQISLFMADNAASEDARRAHRTLANGYAEQIAAVRKPHALTATASWNG